MLNKIEFMRQAELQFEKLQMAEKLAQELEVRIATIRALGFKVIVLGSKVRVT